MSLLNICFDKNEIFIIPDTDKHKFVYLYYLIDENKIDYLKRYAEELNNQILVIESLFFIERFTFNNFNISTLLDFPHIKSFLKKDKENFYFKINYESIYYLSSLQQNDQICNFLLDYVDINSDVIFYSNFILQSICYIDFKKRDSNLLDNYFTQYIKSKNNIDLLIYFIYISKNIDICISILFNNINYSQHLYDKIIFYSAYLFDFKKLKSKINLYTEDSFWLYTSEEIFCIKNKIINDLEKIHIQSLIMDF